MIRTTALYIYYDDNDDDDDDDDNDSHSSHGNERSIIDGKIHDARQSSKGRTQFLFRF